MATRKKAVAAEATETAQVEKAVEQPTVATMDAQAEVFADRVVALPEGYSSLNVREEPSMTADVVRKLKQGETVKVIGEMPGWVGVEGGWTCARYLKEA